MIPIRVDRFFGVLFLIIVLFAIAIIYLATRSKQTKKGKKKGLRKKAKQDLEMAR
jgi:uncharacterized protein (UPF0333 family)